MARRSAMQMDPRTMTGAPRGGGIARSLAPRPQMGPPRGGSRQPMTQSSQPGQQQQMMGEAIGDMAIDAATNGANDQQMPGFGPKPGRMDPRMQGQMQDMMGRLQQSRQSQPSAPMPQYDMPGPSSQYDFADRKLNTPMNNFDNGKRVPAILMNNFDVGNRLPGTPMYNFDVGNRLPGTPMNNFDVGNRMPGAPMGNGFGQFPRNQMQPAPRPTGQPQQMPQGMQQSNSISNFLNRNRFGR